MSSSIASATSNQQYFQQVQTAAKPDATKSDATSATTPPTAPATAQQTPTVSATPTTNGVYVSAAHRNNDGTYGPKHTILPPINAPKPESSDSVAVNVKV